MGDNDKAGLRHTMPGLFNGVATALTAAAGFIGVLYQTGYLGNHAAPEPGARPAEMRVAQPAAQFASANSPVAPNLPMSGAPNRAAPAAILGPRSLSGAWRDGASNCHQIKQTGRALTVTSYFAQNGRVGIVGAGTIKGGVISMRMNMANPASPEADLLLSDNGRVLSGMIKGAKGAHVARWRFVGPSCLQTAPRLD